MTCIALAFLLYLVQAGETSVYEYNIASDQSLYAQLAAQNANLRATAVGLSSTTRIDQAAATQFHMIKPDISGALWVQTVVPALPVRSTVEANTRAAERQSQPAYWLGQTLADIRASL
jgi:hypothetical protein